MTPVPLNTKTRPIKVSQIHPKSDPIFSSFFVPNQLQKRNFSCLKLKKRTETSSSSSKTKTTAFHTKSGNVFRDLKPQKRNREEKDLLNDDSTITNVIICILLWLYCFGPLLWILKDSFFTPRGLERVFHHKCVMIYENVIQYTKLLYFFLYCMQNEAQRRFARGNTLVHIIYGEKRKKKLLFRYTFMGEYKYKRRNGGGKNEIKGKNVDSWIEYKLFRFFCFKVCLNIAFLLLPERL